MIPTKMHIDTPALSSFVLVCEDLGGCSNVNTEWHAEHEHNMSIDTGLFNEAVDGVFNLS